MPSSNLVIETSADTRRSGRLAAPRPFLESTSPLDLFDWKFEKYLTPWIVRFTWLAVLSIAGIGCMLWTINFVLSLEPERPGSQSVVGMDPFQRSIYQPPRSSTKQSMIDPRVMSLVYRVIMLLISFTFTVLWLLWIRVLLECAIVVFNIARSLSSIDEKILKPTGNV
ncbi:DUF4282 domain-containing protein [Anatilimnocola floriformis]|uniref:DUF4282 domain-containing protein n=1 Tax=Anatilimnocola floriformis TaxID=2948575 RepID=UPI0020C44608|nr:DUF4282 domain-containing protein [Anatilimnocola floriformis]